VHLDVGAAVADRAQRAGAAGGDRLVVGEDVVDLVAAGTARGRQPPDRALVALAAGLEDFFGAGLGLEVLFVLGTVVVVLGESEVDERSVSGIA
jgi:hypothetical protein